MMPIESSKDNLNKVCIEWAYNALLSLGFTLKNRVPLKVQDTPWSFVVNFKTDQGIIYLKQTPEELALEAVITQFLYEQCRAPVPEVIAHNTQLNCFLMKDAGSPLRESLRKKFDINFLCNAIEQFSSLQVAAADYTHVFLAMGVPNWCLDELPGLYKQLLSQKDLLISDGLSEVEISKLKAQQSRISNLCKKLSGYSINQTLVQCDFHDNNILVAKKFPNVTFIDLGEIVISHPFFSLVGCLRQMITHHELREKDYRYLQLIDAYFRSYRNYGPREYLLEALQVAHVLWCIYEALAQYRLRLACDPGRFRLVQRQGKLSGRLKEFITMIDKD